MYNSKQILSGTKLIKNFRSITSHLRKEPQALLITQKSGDSLVLVNAEIFEDLVHFRHQATIAGCNEHIDWARDHPI